MPNGQNEFTCLANQLSIYIKMEVTSKPKRISVAAGAVHIISLLYFNF